MNSPAESRQLLSLAVCAMLIARSLALPALAQPAPPPVTRLSLVVLEGEGGLIGLGMKAARDPLVQVADQNGRGVVGAVVVFTLPLNGASGEFGDGSKTLTIVTDDQGRAAARGLRANRMAGKYSIYVNASYRGQSARALIAQFNMETPGSARASKGGGGGKIVAILAVVGAAAAAGAVVALRKNDKGGSATTSTTPGVITITADPGTVGPPR